MVERDMVNHELIVRNSYISDISSIVPFDELERSDIKTSLEWIKSTQNLHKPHNMESHLGVLFMVLTPDFNSTFLINHRKAQLWIPPGGHVDVGLSLQDAVIDECQQELYLKPKFLIDKPFFLTRTLTTGLNSGHIDVTSWFLVEGDRRENYQVQSKEASEGKWFEIDKIINDPTHFYLSRVLKKIKSYF